MRRSLFAAVLVATSFAAPAAHATPNFPAAIRSDVDAPTVPQCTVCHDNPAGGLGTVTTTFGAYMRSRGLVPYDEASLHGALAAARGEMHDSDGDGVDDVDALARGLDPNGARASSAPGAAEPPPEYGCAGRIAAGAPRGGGPGAPVTLGLLVALVIARRSSRARTLDDAASQRRNPIS